MSTTTTIIATETMARRLSQSSVAVSLMAVPREATGGTNISSSSSSNSNHTAGPSTSSTISTLRSLYPRAAHALLQRDFSLTHALIESAFELLTPPARLYSTPDALDTHRRKWEILRITLETSAYASPPASKRVGAGDVLPPALRSNLMLSAPGLITVLHSRSVRLFTPRLQSPKGAFLPAQILVPLVLSSVKLECPEVGRSMIEDWLAQRDSIEPGRADTEGYVRVLELYCLHVLPRMHEWEYAQEFLEYERELPENVRQHFKSALRSLRAQEIESARTIPSPPPLQDSPGSDSGSSSRTPSPSPSVDSGSSSDTDDTHSTRTVVPHTPRPKHGMNGLTPLTPTPSVSSPFLLDSKTTNGHAAPGKRSASPTSTVRAGSSRDSSLGTTSQQDTVNTRNSPSTLALVSTAVRTYVNQLGSSRLLFALLCVILPVFSFLIRLRRRRRRQAGGASTASVDAVRRRLAGQSSGGVLGTIWSEVVRAVTDAVRMAGSGLV